MKKGENMNKEKIIEEYIVRNNLDMEKVVDDYYNYISTIIKNSYNFKVEDEDEMISDVFLIIWKNREKLRLKEKFSPYIAGITKKIIYRKYKEINKSMEIIQYEENIVDDFNIDSIIEQREINNCIANNLKEIGETEYLIFTKFYYEGKRAGQIAKEMNMSVGNVKTKLHRTRIKIKEILKVGGF